MRDRIGTAELISTDAGHEVIHGKTGSGKTYKAKQRIDEDIAEDRSVWIIDLSGAALPAELDLAGSPATTIEDARDLLDAARGIGRRGLFGIRRRLGAPKHPITITVEDAAGVLADTGCRRRLEALLDVASEYQVRLRLVVQNLQIDSFGRSKKIRSAVVGEDAIDRAMGVYRGMTDAEREQVYRNTVTAVARFEDTRSIEPLIEFADALAMTIRMRLIPGYQDRVHASQDRDRIRT